MNFNGIFVSQNTKIHVYNLWRNDVYPLAQLMNASYKIKLTNPLQLNGLLIIIVDGV